ncbi:MAG: hypothetical protein P1V97_39555, partial [Planctomycetota bacterium]|nr:hypothetical protein [Planctomycetota bacterium]
ASIAFALNTFLGIIVAALLSPIWAFTLFNAIMLKRDGAHMILEVNEEGIRHNNNVLVMVRKFDRFKLIPWKLVRRLEVGQSHFMVMVAHSLYADRDDIPPSGTLLAWNFSTEEGSKICEDIRRLGIKYGAEKLE